MAISTTSSSNKSISSRSDSVSSSYSFNTAVGGDGVSAEAAGSYASSRSNSKATQDDFELRSTKSSIITYGGAPGSFGPESDQSGASTNAPSSWGAWAETVDLLPVPIDFTLGRVYDILEQLDSNIQARWLSAEKNFYGNMASMSHFASHKFIMCDLLIQNSYPNLGFPQLLWH